jgi:hypothetical protein
MNTTRLIAPVFHCYWTSILVGLGLFLGTDLLKPSPVQAHRFDREGDSYANWDGQWYKRIAREGYDYSPDAHSSVAYFPAYPLLGRCLMRATGMPAGIALLVVSNTSLLILLCLTAVYVGRRYPDPSGRLVNHVLLAMCLVPTTFFFRMAYSESLFMLIVVLVLYGIERGWPLITVAAVAGLGTAARPVGVGLIPALVLANWAQSRTVRGFVVRSAYLLPIAVWGILAYMAYLYAAFGDPLAFARTQANWRGRPPSSPSARMIALATLEPIRSLLDPSCPANLGASARGHNPLFSLRTADSIYFLGTVAALGVGTSKRWLSRYELATAAALLLIPYATIGYEQYMRSMGRYSAAVVPVYFVLGHLLHRSPPALVEACTGICGFLLALYTAMFATWYVFV